MTNLGDVLQATSKVLIKEARAFVLYRLEGDILFFDYHNNMNVELSDVKEAFDLYAEHSQGYSLKVLIGFGKFSTIEVDARKYSEDKVMPTPAQAIVLHNLAQRMIGRFYQLLRKDKHPLKFFKNENEALSWLKTVNPDDDSQSISEKIELN